MKSHLFLFPFLAIICSCATIRPEPPVPVSEYILPPASVVSLVNMPVELDLTPYFNMAEKNVSTVFEGSENPCEGIRYTYQFLRGPFMISGMNDNLQFSFEGKYKIKGSYCGKCLNDICLLPTPAFSCGYLEPMRTIQVGYSSKLKLLPGYRLSSQTTLQKSEALDKCAISFINIDVTGRLMQVMKEALESAGRTVDSQFRAYDLKPYVNDVWNKLFESRPIGNYGSLNINPVSIAVSDLKLNGSKLKMRMELACKPVFSTSYQKSTPVALPDLALPVGSKGFDVYADLFVRYDDLNVILNSQLAGDTFYVNKKRVIINGIQIGGLGRSKVTMRLDFKGSRKGVVYLVGTPLFDSLSNTISMPDLTFEVKSRNLLLKTANWLLNEKLTKKLKAASVFDMNKLLDQYKVSVNAQLNKQLSATIRMYGGVDEMKVQKLITSPESLFIRVFSSGEVGLQIR